MKIGGRIIQNKNISVSTETDFSAKYKNHYIEIHQTKKEKGENPVFSVEIWHSGRGWAVSSEIQRCLIYDAIIWGLNGALQ